MAAPGITSIKSFSYRGSTEEWSNQYHFTGSAPSDDAGWRDLCDAFVLLEKTALNNTVTILRFLCYTNTDNDSVYTYDLAAFGGTVLGTYNYSAHSAEIQEGNTAYDIRWNTGRTNSKGKPIYLRKYFHPGISQFSTPDAIDSSLKTVCDTFAANVMSSSGDWPGLAGPDGVAPTGYRTLPYLTTRTLKRRGRRPT